jgi:hypothetical protein
MIAASLAGFIYSKRPAASGAKANAETFRLSRSRALRLSLESGHPLGWQAIDPVLV